MKASWIRQRHCKGAQHLDKQEISDSNIRARVLCAPASSKKLPGSSKASWRMKNKGYPSRSHRETILILSLIHSLRGEVELAYSRASAGVELGEQLHSPFIIGCLYVPGTQPAAERDPKLEEARQAYQESLKLVDDIEIARGRAEPLLGLALLEGFHGDSNLGLKVWT